MKSILVFTFGAFLLSSFQVAAQDTASTPKYYWASFTDKANSPYSVDKPSEFLSERAISRRLKRGIPITEQDLPPNPSYLQQLQQAGAQILHQSRWLNAATIMIEEEKLAGIQALSFIDTVFYAGLPYEQSERRQMAFQMDSLLSKPLENEFYGYGADQVKLLNGDTLHQMGYDGKGVWVAVLDGGLIGVEENPFFDSIRTGSRLVLSRDFVDGDAYPFESSTHGTKVLSAMAANVPGVMVGTAPGATYTCIKTEDTRGEYRIEECHWVVGLEYADSIGADLVNSSLGYTTFNDRKMDYAYENLNGRSSVASLAADIAVSKGMIIITSAGNEGNSKWKYVGIPADATQVLAIGATDLKGNRASFSSVGPTADGRIKPDIAAPGAWVTVADAFSFRVSRGSGTSFASPILAGMVASLWGAFPESSNLEIMDAVRQSSSQATAPDNELGYGLPNFGKAYRILSEKGTGQSRQMKPEILPAGQE